MLTQTSDAVWQIDSKMVYKFNRMESNFLYHVKMYIDNKYWYKYIYITT